MQIRLRLNQKILRFPAGTELTLPALEDGQPAELFWRHRVRDSKIDGCVTVLPPAATENKIDGGFAADSGGDES
jgi:hypothetical protein